MQAILSGNGLNLSKFNDFQTLLTYAESYYYLGYSVIPLLGDFDPARPKVAARSWTVYQQRLATLNEFNGWFSPHGGAAALGIVTGRISRLVVLDFDSADLFADFRRRCPDLLETHTVQSAGRALPHLYFHLPSHLHLASQKRSGIDLLSDGRYVVAPPTTIDGQAYRITRGGMPRPLTTDDIQRIQSFITSTHSTPSPSYINVGTAHSSSLSHLLFPLSHAMERGLGGEDASIPLQNAPHTSSIETHHDVSTAPVGKSLKPFHSPISNTDLSTPLSHAMERGLGGEETYSPIAPSRAALHGLYLYWCSKVGRNEALFRTALYARDHGLNETLTRRALFSLHINQPIGEGLRPSRLKPESPQLRQREAYATIRSAFSRPPRPILPPPSVNGEASGVRFLGLPNTLREALMQRKLTCVVRTLEGLYQAGFRPGRGFTTDQAIQALKGIVGRDSVYNALNALAPNGQPFFPQRSPSALPPASKEAARQKQTLKTKKCFFVTEKKSGIKKRGPKQRRFKFPQLAALCKLLDVKTSSSDPLTPEDLTSARQTRMALHRELIKRRPAEYSRRWLANRLGVSRRTINTYNTLIPIHTQPTYHDTPLSWSNIDNLLTDEILAGAHIETLVGKKYPALLSIAKHLLAKGTYCRLKQRKANLYWYGSDNPPPNIIPIASPSVGSRHAASVPLSNPLPTSASSSSVGEGFRPSRSLSSPAPLSTQWREAGGEDVPSVGTRHAASVSSNSPPTPAPLSVNGYQQSEPANVADVGLGVRFLPVDITSPASTSQGKGLKSSHTLSAPAPLSMQWRGAGGEDALIPDQAESLAQAIYTRVNPGTDGTTRQLSLKNARKLARNYAEKDIQFALHRLSQRTNLANPTGFFVTVLRSTARANEF